MHALEKILAKHAGEDEVKAGEIVTCRVDLVEINDLYLQVIESFNEMGGKRVWDPEKVVFVFDRSLFPVGISGSPDACAISITAVLPWIMPYLALTRISGSGPITSTVLYSPLAAVTRASTVPSPPSAMGTFTTSKGEKCRLATSSRCSITSREEKLPLKESGAKTIFKLQPPTF